MAIKNNKSFLPLLSLLFLVGAVSVGVALASGSNPVFTLPKAASCSQAGDSCSNVSCCPGLQANFIPYCVCANVGKNPDCMVGGKIAVGRIMCQDEIAYECNGNGVKVKTLDCVAMGGFCGPVEADYSYCVDANGRRITNSNPKPTTTPNKKESGCGTINNGACSSGTCSKGYVCRKSGTSCGCVKNTTK